MAFVTDKCKLGSNKTEINEDNLIDKNGNKVAVTDVVNANIKNDDGVVKDLDGNAIGSVLQVKSEIIKDTYLFDGASGDHELGDGVKITPLSSDSKIVIECFVYYSSSNPNVGLTITQDGTKDSNGKAYDNYYHFADEGILRSKDDDDRMMFIVTPAIYTIILDDLDKGTEYTFKILVNSGDSGADLGINRAYNNDRCLSLSQIKVSEIL